MTTFSYRIAPHDQYAITADTPAASRLLSPQQPIMRRGGQYGWGGTAVAVAASFGASR